jgi:hypothetical protein
VKNATTIQLNIAPTGSLLFITIEHEAAVTGRQFADHPPKVDPAAGVAVSVTVVPKTKLPAQPAPAVQLIPTGLLTTVPVPKPTVKTLRAGRFTPPPTGPSPRVAVPVIAAPPIGDVPIAVIVVLPMALPKANPVELIVATFTSLDCQVTWSVMSTVFGGVLNVPIAMNCEGSPIVVSVWPVGIIARETSE